MSEDEMEGNTWPGLGVQIPALLFISMQAGQLLFTFGPVFHTEMGIVIFPRRFHRILGVFTRWRQAPSPI